MDALEALHTRRSVRKYRQDSPVSEELIQQIIAAAAMAPSAHNGQPWQFVVIDDRKLLDQIPKSCPHAAMVQHAPLAILICADPSLEKSPGYWPQDCAAAAENMLLAAHALGLGAVWCGVYPREPRMDGLRQLLGFPEDVIGHGLIVLGHPAEQPPSEERYREDRIHRNRWT